MSLPQIPATGRTENSHDVVQPGLPVVEGANEGLMGGGKGEEGAVEQREGGD